jgi:hypothetical protein
MLLKPSLAGRQWLTHIIIATHEGEIRRITFWSQPGQNILETLSRKKKSQEEMLRLTPRTAKKKKRKGNLLYPGDYQPPIINEWGGSWVVPWGNGGDVSSLHPGVWITYTHLQLKRKLKESELSTWYAIFSHICFKNPKLFLLAFHVTGENISQVVMVKQKRISN